jgi:uncharacterized MAPEG superfamily protein
MLSKTNKMTVPLWGLVIFIFWTISIVTFLVWVRIIHLMKGGSIQDFATPNDKSLLWRLYRVQANLVENLPLYLGVVFLLRVQNVAGTTADCLIVIYMGFRILHSFIHIAGLNPIFRVLSLAIQFSCLIALTTLTIFVGG